MHVFCFRSDFTKNLAFGGILAHLTDVRVAHDDNSQDKLMAS